MKMPLSPVSNLWPTISQPPYSKYVSHSDDIRMEHRQIDRRSSVDLQGGRRRRQLIRTVVMILTSFVSGSVASYLALRLTSQEDEVLSGNIDTSSHFDQGYSIRWSKRLMSEVNADDIAVNLRNYTVRVHISGTQGNNRLRDLLKDQLKSCDNVQVKLFSYDVLLSYHNWEQPNSVSVKANDGSIIYQTKYRGPPIEDDPRPADHPELTEPYVAYSPNASIQGRLTLVAEFEQLDGNVSFSESVVLMKLGKLPVKNMVSIAERHGALGLLLFSDTNEAFDNTSVYSHSSHTMRLPGWATRRASLHLFGDPLTPGFPSRDFMKRIPLAEANLPRIPVQSIGADDANHLIKLLTGSVDFIDDLNGNSQLQNNWTVQMDVFNELERREITNVLGVFRGRLEPDRYVIVGCRYDAWTYGGVSPNTGTAVMMELVKALTKLSNEGWSPRRTVIFANWDAGQMGLVGAFEWIEDREQDLINRALSYIDLNSAVSGNSTLLVQASPLLKQLTINSARLTDYERPRSNEGPAANKRCSGSTVFDAWMCQRSFQSVSKAPRFEQVTTDSEAAAFYFFLGIPVVWARFVNQDSSGEPEVPTSVYDTSLDTFDYVRRYVDPLFHTHKTMVGFVLEMILQLSSLSRLPLDVHELSTAIEEETKLLCQGARHFKDSFSNLASAVYNLTQTTAQFRNKFLEISDSNLLMVRQYNDKVMKFSQSFIGTVGLSEQPQFRNILFGPSKDNYNQIRIWPKIQEVLDETTNAVTEKDFEVLQDEMTKELSTAIAVLRSATYILSDDIFL